MAAVLAAAIYGECNEDFIGMQTWITAAQILDFHSIACGEMILISCSIPASSFNAFNGR